MHEKNFADRHIGPRNEDLDKMLQKVGVKSLDELIDKTIPPSIRLTNDLDIPPGISEYEYFNRLKESASRNKIYKTYIGQGFYGTILPAVIQRNILENPSWYTSYTPYQAEISQGRLEALLNFQTMVTELTGMELANASLLDEATAASEAMIMMYNLRSRQMVKEGIKKFFVDLNIFSSTIDVLKAKADPLGIELEFGNYTELDPAGGFFGTVVQYPAADGVINDYRNFIQSAHNQGVLVGVVADLLSLALITPPGEWDADIVLGSTQRFGIPMGYGGPHAAYFATREKYKRNLPGRIIGVSIDGHEDPALRMALQTREQHIKRERATSNICTAQALLASMAGMYGVYHGPDGLIRIARQIHLLTETLSRKLSELNYEVVHDQFFDTLLIRLPDSVVAKDFEELALAREVNLHYSDRTLQVSLDETTSLNDLQTLLEIFAVPVKGKPGVLKQDSRGQIPDGMKRTSDFMTQDVFHRYRSETELMRYIKKLERKDFSLTHSMISLGSCTMKLNAAVEMLPMSWPEFANLHPFVPLDQAEGYQELINDLAKDLKAVTGLDEISFMPNSGASGEYAGLIVIRAYHQSRGEHNRDVCLIPASAHGTNPASAVMAGLKVVVVECDDKGNIDLDCLTSLAKEHKDNLGAFMITYPSTHGVFEEEVREMIDVIHKYGGQVYMDGANMNAQVGLTNPAVVGTDVCHLNLHKTFAIPHGGGGPGMGPIAVAGHLVEFLPTHPVIETGGINGVPAVSGSPWGSASILAISHAYIKLMGGEGLTYATKMAILSANYLASSLGEYYDVLYTGKNGFVGHEMILECRNFKEIANITEADIAKRLMDFGFHAPTLSFPVHGTLMVEPTESESLEELDRFISALVAIHGEIMDIKSEKSDPDDNPLKNAPHTQFEVTRDDWPHAYTRKQAAFPLPWVEDNKFWPAVGRVDDTYGDRNLVCTCGPIESYGD